MLIRPKATVLLGATALYSVLGKRGITKNRGIWFESKGFYFMPTYHPSALLRDESKKKDAWHDLQLVMERLNAPEDGQSV